MTRLPPEISMQNTIRAEPSPQPTCENATGRARMPVPMTELSMLAVDGMMAMLRSRGDRKPPVLSSDTSLTDPRRAFSPPPPASRPSALAMGGAAVRNRERALALGCEADVLAASCRQLRLLRCSI